MKRMFLWLMLLPFYLYAEKAGGDMFFAMKMESTSGVFVGKINNTTNSFIDCGSGQLFVNDNQVLFLGLDGNVVKTKRGVEANATMFIGFRKPFPCFTIPPSGIGWFDSPICWMTMAAQDHGLNSGFYKIVWKRLAAENISSLSNSFIVYVDNGNSDFNPSNFVVPKNDGLDVVISPKMQCGYRITMEELGNVRELIFFVRNNNKNKCSIVGECVCVLNEDGSDVIVDGKPLFMKTSHGGPLAAGQSLFLKDKLATYHDCFVKSKLPDGFYHLRWKVEVKFEGDDNVKALTSNAIPFYYGKYEVSKPNSKPPAKSMLSEDESRKLRMILSSGGAPARPSTDGTPLKSSGEGQ